MIFTENESFLNFDVRKKNASNCQLDFFNENFYRNVLYTTKPLYISFIFHKKNIRLSINIFDLLATRAVSIFRAHMHALVYLAYLKPQYETCFHSFSWNRIVHYIVHTYNLKNIRNNRLIFSLIGLVSCYGISVSQVTINNYVVPFVMIKILSFFPLSWLNKGNRTHATSRAKFSIFLL